MVGNNSSYHDVYHHELLSTPSSMEHRLRMPRWPVLFHVEFSNSKSSTDDCERSRRRSLLARSMAGMVMNWLMDPDRVRVQWYLIGLNGGAALLNIVVFSWQAYLGHWTGLACLISGVFSGYCTWKLYRRLPEVRARQTQKIMDILSGKYG